MDDNRFNNDERYNNDQGFILVNTQDENENKGEQSSSYDPKKPNKKKRKFRGSMFSYVALALVCSIVGGLASTFIAPMIFKDTTLASKEYTPQAITINTNDDISTVSAVAKKAMSSVVGITTIETQDLFWFGQRDVSGVGSGLIVDSDGYILTNSHVVANGNAKDIRVLFDNGDKVQGKVLWYDATLDLAIVKVDVTGLPVATLGDSDDLEVGEIAIAIGNPLGLEFQRSVTSGIISGLHRSVQVDQVTVIDDLIQTDASINPGNSGGPLLNSKGEVIGINTAKITSGEGLGFSIPINQAKAIVNEVLKKGSYKTVYMGISGMSVEEYEGRVGVKLPVDTGLVIIQVEKGSPADKAGLYNGDVITKIDDIEIDSMSQVKKALYKYKQGDRANISIIRNGNESKLEIVFTKLN
ncbi:serine protease HtrA [Paratissierella segnis]|jgi:S1-C subfamily serine protease|uniref:Trypsin-like peptidase domain-containing protein n=1 Tax=Paratissierella segnis TaxID=2763679 RepID=A0A926ES11_9FIRM|nr:trypsin-like peptidase domain-containing protein [Paratissierella segnis]MBC8587153.1 trypsin-like peptidase domain-containing protein [Paratissierella segnis]